MKTLGDVTLLRGADMYVFRVASPYFSSGSGNRSDGGRNGHGGSGGSAAAKCTTRKPGKAGRRYAVTKPAGSAACGSGGGNADGGACSGGPESGCCSSSAASSARSVSPPSSPSSSSSSRRSNLAPSSTAAPALPPAPDLLYSKPCHDCQVFLGKCMKKYGLRKVYYTTGGCLTSTSLWSSDWCVVHWPCARATTSTALPSYAAGLLTMLSSCMLARSPLTHRARHPDRTLPVCLSFFHTVPHRMIILQTCPSAGGSTSRRRKRARTTSRCSSDRDEHEILTLQMCACQ